MKEQVRYPIQASPFYKMQLNKIAGVLTLKPKNIHHPKYKKPTVRKLLALTLQDIENFSNNDERAYQLREINDKKGKKRITEVPVMPLKLLHKKFSNLLGRIEPPDYLHSATKGRSYVDNGAKHSSETPAFKIDLKKFFPSTTSNYVYDFFRNTMHCDGDVAALLTKFCTYNHHIPTGSPLSPILSFYAHKGLFDEINELCISHDCVMTLYVDDISVSGSEANRELLFKIKKLIKHHGLKHHKAKNYSRNSVKKFTGIIIANGQVKLRNRSHQAIHKGMKALEMLTDPREKKILLAQLIGQTNEAKQIDPKFEAVGLHLKAMKVNLEKRLNKLAKKN